MLHQGGVSSAEARLGAEGWRTAGAFTGCSSKAYGAAQGKFWAALCTHSRLVTKGLDEELDCFTQPCPWAWAQGLSILPNEAECETGWGAGHSDRKRSFPKAPEKEYQQPKAVLSRKALPSCTECP